MDGLCDFLDGKLANNECEISEVEIKRGLYEPTTLKCKLKVNLTSDDERNLIIRSEYGERFTGGWTRPPKKTVLETIIENSRYGLECEKLWPKHNPYIDNRIYNDWGSAREALEHKKHNSIEKVIFNNPATIVIWKDGSKTVVKCEEDRFDPEKGLAMAIAKHFLGTNKTKSDYYDVFEKWIPKIFIEDKQEAVLYADNTPYMTVTGKWEPVSSVITRKKKKKETNENNVYGKALNDLGEILNNIEEINEAVSDAVHEAASMFRSEPKESVCDNIIDSLKKSDRDTDINL